MEAHWLIYPSGIIRIPRKLKKKIKAGKAEALRLVDAVQLFYGSKEHLNAWVDMHTAQGLPVILTDDVPDEALSLEYFKSISINLSEKNN